MPCHDYDLLDGANLAAIEALQLALRSRANKDGMNAEEIEVLTEDLCAVYGCERCPGWVKDSYGTPVFCTHDCNPADCDA